MCRLGPDLPQPGNHAHALWSVLLNQHLREPYDSPPPRIGTRCCRLLRKCNILSQSVGTRPGIPSRIERRICRILRSILSGFFRDIVGKSAPRPRRACLIIRKIRFEKARDCSCIWIIQQIDQLYDPEPAVAEAHFDTQRAVPLPLWPHQTRKAHRIELNEPHRSFLPGPKRCPQRRHFPGARRRGYRVSVSARHRRDPYRGHVVADDQVAFARDGVELERGLQMTSSATSEYPTRCRKAALSPQAVLPPTLVAVRPGEHCTSVAHSMKRRLNSLAINLLDVVRVAEPDPYPGFFGALELIAIDVKRTDPVASANQPIDEASGFVVDATVATSPPFRARKVAGQSTCDPAAWVGKWDEQSLEFGVMNAATPRLI